MAFNESILIKNLLVVSLRGKSQAFIELYNWEAQRQFGFRCSGIQGYSTTDKNPLSPSLTPAFLRVFFTVRLSAGFHCSYSLHSYKTRGLLLSSTYISPHPRQKDSGPEWVMKTSPMSEKVGGSLNRQYCQKQTK